MIKKNDKVVILAGKDKGKQGEVKEVIASKDKVVVTGVNMISKHVKPNGQKKGGIQKMEAPLHVSNVALYCAKCKKGTTTASKVLESGEKVRVCKTCKENI